MLVYVTKLYDENDKFTRKIKRTSKERKLKYLRKLRINRTIT